MNNPSPLIPQGSLERQSKNRSTVRIAILTIVSIHAVFFAGLLMQGCRRDDAKTPARTAEAETNQNTLPPLESDYYPATQDVAQASPPPLPAAAPAQPAYEFTSPPPPAPALAPADLPQDGKTYTIKKGDTLRKIARANGVTLSALTKANPNLNAAKLIPGSPIQIPPGANGSLTGSTALTSAEPKSEAAPASAANIHRVKPKETLTKIAQQNGTTVKAIRAANHLKSDRLIVGQKLKIPARTAGAATDSKRSDLSKLTATTPTNLGSSGTYAR